MSITDELRKYARGYELTVNHKLLEIADRIDAEHERALAEQFESLTVDMTPMTDENMAEHGWVRLPVDADGEVIHIGDRVEDNERVVRIVLTDGSWEPSVYVEKLPNVLHEHFCNEIVHYHEPTVEDVLRKFAEKMNENMGMYTGEVIDAEEWGTADSATISEYADKLRKLGVDDG